MKKTEFISLTFGASALALAMLVSGCTSPTYSEPDRTGIEQLLLSTAVDRALEGVELPELNGRKVYFDASLLESYDVNYVRGAIRALLAENGALLVDSRYDSEIIVEARSGALGIDGSKSLLGIPEIPLLVPGAGGVTIPELALYSSRKQDSVSKLALLAYNREGERVFSTPALAGYSHFHNYSVLLLIDLNFTDIPEREDF